MSFAMFDVSLRQKIDPVLNKIALKLSNRFSANQLTLFGFVFGFIAFLCILDGAFILALIFIVLNRLFDGLDGAVARLTNTQSPQGGFLDILCDFCFYGLIPLGFAFQDFDNAAASSFLLFSFYLNGGAFLAFALLSEKKGVVNATPSKAFTYMTGLAEGFETILFFCFFCLFSYYYAVLALIFGLICLISAVTRIVQGFRQLA